MISAAELAHVYHSIMHHHSYLSMDCATNLNRIIFSDSKIAAKMTCGRTKASSIVCNVLSPISIERHLKYLIENNIKFSIANDASNKGNRKMFPISVQYFHCDDGITNFIMDFYETAKESSQSIYAEIKERLKQNNLKIENIVAFTADNAPVNYGVNNSVFANLKYENDSLIKANCLCHILHNTAKYSFIKYPIDIQNLVIKIYGYFATSAKRNYALKECFEFSNTEFKNVLKHSPTRWLSLHLALERLINNLDQIKLFFIGIDKLDLDDIIEIAYPESDDTNKLNEMYLNFAYDFTKSFTKTILLLEKKSTNSIMIYSIMKEFKIIIENRIKIKFFGGKNKNLIKQLTTKSADQFVEKCIQVYERALFYLVKWFNFDKSIFKKFRHLNLDYELKYEKIGKIVKTLNLNIDDSNLCDEIPLINEAVKRLDKTNSESQDKLWTKLLRKKKFPEMHKVIEAVLAVPISNALY